MEEAEQREVKPEGPPPEAGTEALDVYDLAAITRWVAEQLGVAEVLLPNAVRGKSYRPRPGTRLFRAGYHPPLRGTLFTLDAQRHVLYTRGSVPFCGTYPGMYIPSPLPFRLIDTESSPEHLAEELLALTKVNWKRPQLDARQPLTIRTADANVSVTNIAVSFAGGWRAWWTSWAVARSWRRWSESCRRWRQGSAGSGPAGA